MPSARTWLYEESKMSGVDYSQAEEVAAYDEMHKKFRDYAKSADQIIRRLGLGSGSTVIDLGSGTGAFALHAAKHCGTVYAIDVSAPMIAYCRQRAAEDGLTNIVFCQAGLLTYQHTAGPVDAAVCVAVLHHLPDFWKLAALTRCRAMLKPRGKLYLFDVVFPSGEADIEDRIDAWIASVETMADARLAQEAVIHARDEFSTYDWIMEGIVRRSGLCIDAAEYGDGFGATYVCTNT